MRKVNRSKFIIEAAVSAVFHTVIVAILFAIPIASQTKARVVEVTSNVVEEVNDDFVDLVQDLNDDAVSLDAPVNLMASASTGAGAGGVGGGLTSPSESTGAEMMAVAALDSPTLNRPLSTTGANVDLGGNVEGLLGTTVAGGSGGGGDSGSVDRISREILRQLQKNKVVVAWIMDASLSLATRREQVVNRFDRIYHELDELGKDKNHALLTGIVAFGEKTVFQTPEPTADINLVKKAVREIKEDPSGKENIFAAVKETALKWRKYQTRERRTLMIIILTDEIGDDPSLLDDTVAQVTRFNIPVYVMGPMAPFGRKEITIAWTDKPTGETFQVPVERGPETVQPEHLALPFWSGAKLDVFPSGFGPYALTRLVRESGGLYFMYDDNSIPGPKFNSYDLLEYAPDYQSIHDYRTNVVKNPLRAAVIKAAEDSKGAQDAPPSLTFRDGDTNAITNSQRTVAKTLYFAEKALENLKAVEKYREKEKSRRWQAHYDLMMGRLLAAVVRCNEYNWALAQIKLGTKTHTAGKNAWRFVPEKDLNNLAFGKVENARKADNNVRKADANATAKARKAAEEALAYLNRVVTEHKGTPWAVMAEQELAVPLGFRWEEDFIEPPKMDANPPTPAQSEAAKKRQEAMKRIPKL